jgi:hypothetical protein
MSENLKFPIGEFDKNIEVTDELRNGFISDLRELPLKVRSAVESLSDEQLDMPYRPEGWTVRQVIHHIADSHLNAFIRIKLALTEDVPTIRPYDEAEWAKLSDSELPIEPSMKIIEGVHTRLVEILSNLSDDDFKRKLDHPDSGEWKLENFIGLYAWHGKHHTAHIRQAGRITDE